MIERTDTDTVPLEGSSPFELRTDLSKNVPESVVKKALETGDTGSCIHSPPVRQLMVQVFASSRGRRAVSFVVFTATTPTRGT